MRENSPTLTTADLQLLCILDASPVCTLGFNDRQEIFTAHPPTERLFDLSPNAGSPQRCAIKGFAIKPLTKKEVGTLLRTVLDWADPPGVETPPDVRGAP